jgi:hypothetical protein
VTDRERESIVGDPGDIDIARLQANKKKKASLNGKNKSSTHNSSPSIQLSK